MSAIKHIVSQGIYYQSIGGKDYATWSRMMCDEFGPDISPSIAHIRKWSLMLPDMLKYGREVKINCWEFMGCGLNLDRDYACSDEVALCPASLEGSLKGLHGGQNAGRACWLVSRTLCRGVRQETDEQKRKTCLSCDFYTLVLDEEDGSRITLLS